MNDVPWQISASLFVHYAKRYREQSNVTHTQIRALNLMRSDLQWIRAIQAMLL